MEAKAGARSATLSVAYTVVRFVDACMWVLDGNSDIYKYAYVQSNVTDLPFFAATVKLGMKVVEKTIGEDLEGLAEYKKKAIYALKAEFLN